MILLLIFVISFSASTIGAIVGAGGGTVIKPAVDAFGLYTASELSFMSGCAVLAMTVSSLLRTRGDGVRLDTHVSTPIAIGSAVGGVLGKWLFSLIKSASGDEVLVGGVQSICLASVITLVLLYMVFKRRLPSWHVRSRAACGMVGLVLGLVSSFIGIGGGPQNVAVLLLLFSMETKQAARNSLYIILYAQTANLLFTLITRTLPAIYPPDLLLMMLGGVLGALAGARVSRRLNNGNVDRLCILLDAVVIALSLRNVFYAFL